MTKRYFVTYDIADPDRLRRVFKVMKGAGDHVQFSVFRCDLSDVQREVLLAKLRAEIHAVEDQVLFIDLGPSEGEAEGRVTALGRSYDEPTRGCVII